MRSTERQRELFQHLSAAITSVPVLQGKDLSMWPEKQDSVALTSQKLASLAMELETAVVSAIWDPRGAGKMLGNRRDTRRVTRIAWQLLPASGMLPGKAGFWRKEWGWEWGEHRKQMRTKIFWAVLCTNTLQEMSRDRQCMWRLDIRERGAAQGRCQGNGKKQWLRKAELARHLTRTEGAR